nr:hypothetical protein [Tanacetum cinerariifolium]
MHKAFPLLGESSHWQYKFPLPVEGVPTAKRMEIPLPRVCTDEETVSYTKKMAYVLPMIVAVTEMYNSMYKDSLSQQAATRNRGKAIINSPPPKYDQKPTMVAEDDEMSKDKEIGKLMDLISLSFKKIYKPTNNSLRTSSNTSRANQDNSPRINRGTGYDNQRIVNVAEAMETVGDYDSDM